MGFNMLPNWSIGLADEHLENNHRMAENTRQATEAIHGHGRLRFPYNLVLIGYWLPRPPARPDEATECSYRVESPHLHPRECLSA